jgi:hypothetical protein
MADVKYQHMYGGEPCRRHYAPSYVVCLHKNVRANLPDAAPALPRSEKTSGVLSLQTMGLGLFINFWELSLVRAYFRGAKAPKLRGLMGEFKQEQGSGARGKIDKGRENFVHHPRHPR